MLRGRQNEPTLIPFWRNRDFLLLWTGQVVSTTGSRVSGIAYPLLVLALTGSAGQAGLVSAAQTAPFLVWFVPAGAHVDRWPRKWILLVADAARAIALASVAVAVLLGRLTIGSPRTRPATRAPAWSASRWEASRSRWATPSTPTA